MAQERICENPGCNESLEGKKKNAKFCSDSCRASYSNKKMKNNQQLGFPRSFQGLGMTPQHMPQNGGAEFFLLTEKVKELQEEKRELKKELEEERRKKEKLKDELNKKDIEILRNEKPAGLAGLDSDFITTALGVTPQILEQLRAMMSGGNKDTSLLEGLDIQKQQIITKFAAILAQLPEEQSQHFGGIVQEASKGNFDTAIQLINSYKNKYSHGTKAITG
jgi:hypothetical protein